LNPHQGVVVIKRIVFTLLVSVAGFAAIVSIEDPDMRFDAIAYGRAEGASVCRVSG
jgi:hypothetical protein